MKLLLFTLALAGGALAQTQVPALPPTPGTSMTGTSAVGTPTRGTSGASTAPDNAGRVMLRFAPQPGTQLEYRSQLRQTFQVGSVRLEPLPNVRLTGAKERERQTLEARFQREFASTLPQPPTQSLKQFVKVLSPLPDGTQVVLVSTVSTGAGGQSVTVSLRQTLRPDGTVQSELLDAGDPAVRRMQATLGALIQQSGSLAGVDARVFGQPLTPGQSLSRNDTVDLGQLLGSALSSFGPGGSASGSLHALSVMTYRGQDAAGNAQLSSTTRFDDTTVQLKLSATGTMQFSLRGLTASAHTSLRPDGLLAQSSVHTGGDMSLTLDIPNQPFRLVVSLKLTQDIQTVLK